MKNRVQRVHLVGIGGAGMSAIAQVLLAQGFAVSGSDLAPNDATARLEANGATVFIAHAASQLQGAQVVVVSTAIEQGNIELDAARIAGIPIIPRAVMLGELMRRKCGIAISGTHGKTTTSALIAHLLSVAGLNPIAVIGGRLNRGLEPAVAQGSATTAGEFLVAEADESDASFLHLLPTMVAVTNIDADHMATYQHDVEKLHAAFLSFIEKIPFYGVAVLCADDLPLAALRARVTKPVLSYGLADEADLRAIEIRVDGSRMHFVAVSSGRAPLPVALNLAGLHNVRNALAAIAIARECGCTEADIARGLNSFAGVVRRFQSYGEIEIQDGHALLVDDYGHHPAEIAAVIAAVRGAYPKRRVLLAFQPHRYSRTQDLFNQFVEVLALADAVVLTSVYAAGEAAIEGANAEALANALKRAVSAATPIALVASIQALPETLLRDARDGDLILTMGAGSIGTVAPLLAAQAMTARARPSAGVAA